MPLGNMYGSTELMWREKELTRMVSEGMKNAEIASAMGTTYHVVKNRLRVVYDKTGMGNRTELALWFESHKEK